MDFMSPLTFDILNIQTWKVKMSMYLKALRIHVYLATINDSYCLNGKNLEANAKAMHALKSTLNDDYLCRVLSFGFCIMEHYSIPWRTKAILCGERLG